MKKKCWVCGENSCTDICYKCEDLQEFENGK